MRARNIKPGFFKNEDLAECSMAARLMFPGLWMMADRMGRLEYRPKRIKGELFPFDNIDAEALLNELGQRGLIKIYEVDGRKLIWIPCFLAHQNPHPKEKALDLPRHPDDKNTKETALDDDNDRVNEQPRTDQDQTQDRPRPNLGQTQTIPMLDPDQTQVRPRPNLGQTQTIPRLDPDQTQVRPRPNLGQTQTIPRSDPARLNPESLILNPDSLIPDSLIPESGFLNSRYNLILETEKTRLSGNTICPEPEPGPELEVDPPEWVIPDPTPTKHVKQVQTGLKNTTHFSGTLVLKNNAPQPPPDPPTSISPVEPVFIAMPLNDGSKFHVTIKYILKLSELYPAVDVEQECRNMAGWLDANKTKRKTRRGIEHFINSWLSRKLDQGGTRPGRSPTNLQYSETTEHNMQVARSFLEKKFKEMDEAVEVH